MSVLALTDGRVLGTIFEESVSKILGEKDVVASDYPQWVKRGADRVNRALFPRVYDVLKKRPVPRPYALGVAFGMMMVSQKQMADLVGGLPIKLPEPTKEQLAAGWSWLYGESAGEHTQLPNGDWIAPEIREEFRQIEAELSPADFKELHRGIFDATCMLTGENAATQTTALYKFMVIFWRVIDRLPTGPSFVDFVTKGLGQNIVGEDEKSILQAARRIGKTFGKPGRPKKTTSKVGKR